MIMEDIEKITKDRLDKLVKKEVDKLLKNNVCHVDDIFEIYKAGFLKAIELCKKKSLTLEEFLKRF